MAKTFLVGEGAVRLIPNAATFHKTARAKLAADPLHVGVELKPNMTGFTRDARAKLKTVEGLSVKVSLKPDVTGFAREAQAKIDATRDLKARVAVEARVDRGSVANAHREIQAQLSAMGPVRVSIESRVDDASLRRAIETLRARVTAANITANINSRNGRGPLGGMGDGGGGGGRGGSGRPVRKAAIATGTVMAPIVTQAAVGGLTALIGAASQAAGALGLLPAAATAAGAGLAAIAIGAVGIGGAFSALSDASKSAGTAVTQSASQQAAAQRGIEAADRGLATAHRGVTRALEDLNDARKDAVRRLRDMNDEMKMAPINEREAALAIKEAVRRVQEATASGDALEIEGAQIDLEKSRLQYDQLRKQNDDLANDVAAANRKGVEGDKQVIAAKDGVVDANNALKDAQDALTAAMESAANAANQMAGGVDKVAQAMDRLSPKAQQFVRQIHALGPAWTETRKFIQDALFNRLGDSVTKLAGVQLPVLRTGLAGIATEINGGLRGALATFSTEQAAMDFTTTLNNSRGMWAGIAQSFAPFAQAFMNVTTVGSTFMPRLGTAVSNMASNFKQFTDEARADGSMQEFFENSLTMAKQLGRILANVGAIIGEIFSAGAETGGGFLNTIETATGELRAFLGSVEGQEGLKTFFNGVKEAVQTLAPIITIVGDVLLTVLGPALTDLVIGMGPGLVAMFQGLGNGLAAIQPIMETVGVAFGQIGFELGKVFEVLGPVIAEVFAALAPAIGPLAALLGSIIKGLAPILTLVGGVVGALVGALAPAFQTITDALGPVIAGLVDALMPIIPPLAEAIGAMAGALAGVLAEIIGALAPVITQIATGFADLVIAILPIVPVFAELITSLLPGLMTVINAILPLFPTIVQALVSIVSFIVPILIPVLKVLSTIVSTVFTVIANVIGWAIRNIIVPVLTWLIKGITNVGDIAKWLWDNALKPVIDFIVDGWKWLWSMVEPVFDALRNGISRVGDFFSTVVDGIGTAWGRLVDIAKTPINWVINHVINGGIGRAWKAVDNFLGGHMPDWVDVSPIGMASGGEVPMAAGAVRGKDSVRILGMPGEHMWDVMDVARAGGQQAMYRMRDMVMKGKPFTWTPAGLADAEGDGALPRYAKGGELSAGDRLAPLPGEGGLQPIAQLMARIIKGTWPKTVTSIGGYRPPDGYNEHSSGRALDVMVAELGGKTGDEVTEFSMANHPNYPVTHTIWKQQMHYPPDGRTEGMDDRGSPTQNHMDHPHIWYAPNQGPINPNIMPDNIAFGGVTDAAVRKGITAWAEKAFNTALAPVKKLLDTAAFNPPPEIKATPRELYKGMVEPAKEKLLDKVSELTSVEGWKNMLGGAVDKVKSGAGNLLGGLKRVLFDTGGVIRPGTTVVQNDTGRDEYMLNPMETVLLRGLVAALRGIGISPVLPQQQPLTPDTGDKPLTPETGPADVNIAGVGGKSTAPGELPVPEQTEIKPPTAADLDDGLPGTGSGAATIPLKRNPDGTYTSTDPEWAKLIKRESGGDPTVTQKVTDVNSGGNEASGLFQIAKGTWASNGGTKFAPTAGEATPEQQAEIAAKIFNEQGGSPWGSGAGQNFGREDEALLRKGIRPAGTKDDPISVTVDTPSDDPSKDWATTAETKPGDKTGSAYGQNLQGAAIGKDGSYKPDNNVPSVDKGGNIDTKPMFTNPFETFEGKLGMGFAKNAPLGIGGPQAEMLSKKAPAVTELANGIAKAAPAWGAALAGNPAALIANIGQATGQWATKTASDFANYIPEAAPGMLESALSAIGGPLIGTVNTGVSTDELMSTMEDAQNRQMRRTKAGRRRY
ncbi:tail length tape measure protein [Gordonia phage Kabluna]|uniref:Tape measure protein n=1 Tax=Gordonia phage Kabluna TaxID=2041511 RepID=A0A2D1GCP8_9CAUD|nr:tail length tape measure protein [Gordonia phage Kabluna]ATN89563.1 tape measure protein [Gordonia phage Kabluna]